MILLEPFHTDALDLKNRVVMAPMTRTRADNPELAATDLIAEYYEQRATAGLIITEGTHVSRMARGAIRVPGIYTKQQIDGWRKSTDAVHAKGGGRSLRRSGTKADSVSGRCSTDIYPWLLPLSIPIPKYFHRRECLSTHPLRTP
ncbi:MAG: hypothetical protein LUF85_06335 [Bacteroides sp.]|nr:hypothetical protein [Bacteroides sp.]